MQDFKTFFYRLYTERHEYSETHVVYPGGFKPPHKGHFRVLEMMLQKYKPTKAHVFVGTKERDGITQDNSNAIWNVYVEAAGWNNVDVVSVELPPVREVVDLVDSLFEVEIDDEGNRYAGNTDIKVIVVAGEEDVDRYGYFLKHPHAYKNVIIEAAPPQYGRISGTATRKAINDGSDDYSWVPDVAQSFTTQIKTILQK